MSYENIILEKGMYATNKGFSATLEELDPSENYIGTPLEGLDAYERQLKRFDISVAGKNSDTVQKFFSTTSSAALFPEFVSRAVQKGIELQGEKDLSKILATTTKIDSKDYRTMLINWGNDINLDPVEEGAQIPETEIELIDKVVTLKKFAKMLCASYESLKFQRLDVFAIALRHVGENIARQQFDEAIKVLIKGDSAENGGCAVMPEAESIGYAQMLDLWSSLFPYKLTTLAISPDFAKKLYQIDEFKNYPLAGVNFQGTGKFGTPLGADIVCSKAVQTNGMQVVGFDKNYSLEKVVASDVMIESDKLIDRQIERTVVSTIVGFSKLSDNSMAGYETV